MRAASWFGVVLGVQAFLVPSSQAGDRSLGAAKLVMKQSAGGSRLRFVAKDPGFLFPPIGSPDDPGVGLPGGALVEVLSAGEGLGVLAIPAGTGRPGWAAKDRAVDVHTFVNPMAPAGPTAVKRVVLRQGRALRVDTMDAGLPLAGMQGAVGIRITTGTLRNCVLFDAPSTDTPGRFVAARVTAAALADCGDAALGLPPTTTTTSSSTTSVTTTSVTTTTSTTLPMCSGEGGFCVAGAGCCPGLTCLLTGGPGELGSCTSATCSGLHQVCGIGGLPCCPGRLCATPPGFPTSPYKFCQDPSEFPPQCCDRSDVGLAICSQFVVPDPFLCPTTTGSTLVCDGVSGTCQAARTGVSQCCAVPATGGCFEGPDPAVAALCTLAGGTLTSGQACLPSGECATP